MMRFYCLFAVLYLCCSGCVFSQKNKKLTEISKALFEPRDANTMRLMFYNVENLFDTIDDPRINDNEFLPDGTNRWNSFRYYKKLKNTSKVITAVGGWEAPDIIGFCEIENRFVLEQLIRFTPLKTNNYETVHYDSPDQRGIDVGMIYRPEKFKVLHSEPLNIYFDNDPEFKTRDVLYVKGLAFNKDTLHVFINHWPSRRGGETQSEPKRIQAATVVRNKINTILQQEANANIVVMGDLNDYPDNRSINEILSAKQPDEATATQLANLMYEKHQQHDGTHKYQSHWGCLDQIIVSKALLDTDKLSIKNKEAFIFKSDFLLKDDARYMGKEPFRTYEGPKYTGGYSDHLPVFVDVMMEKR